MGLRAYPECAAARRPWVMFFNPFGVDADLRLLRSEDAKTVGRPAWEGEDNGAASYAGCKVPKESNGVCSNGNRETLCTRSGSGSRKSRRCAGAETPMTFSAVHASKRRS